MASAGDRDGDPLAAGFFAPRSTRYFEAGPVEAGLPHAGPDLENDRLHQQLEALAASRDQSGSFEADRSVLRARLEATLADGSLARMLLRPEGGGAEADAAAGAQLEARGLRTQPGAAMPSKSPPVPMSVPLAASRDGASLVEGTLVEDLDVQDEAPPPPGWRRPLRVPKPTQIFRDPPVDAAQATPRKSGGSPPGALPAGDLAAQLEKELLQMKEQELAGGYRQFPSATNAWTQSEEVITSADTRDSVVEGHVVGEDRLMDKLAGGAPVGKLRIGDRTPDFSGYPRLTPLILESFSSRLAPLSKEEIRSENQALREQIRDLRSEIRRRREEQLGGVAAGT